jgi:hypothetical protein
MSKIKRSGFAPRKLNCAALNVIAGVSCTAYPILVGLALASYSSGAISAPGTDEQQAACAPDVFRLCSSEIPNVDHILQCMNAKKISLSPACKAVFTPENSATKVRYRTEPKHR